MRRDTFEVDAWREVGIPFADPGVSAPAEISIRRLSLEYVSLSLRGSRVTKDKEKRGK